ncbi:MAG: DUF4349 domain-containing protein [Frankiaceae bacterium]|nr:DUF4349 domain-containing protein [Frankiaceae bacterium]
MSTIRDEDLTRLLDEAASSYDVPEHGPAEVLAALADQPARPPVVRRRWVQLSAAAVVITAGAVFVATQYGGNDAVNMKTTTAQRADGGADRFTSLGGGDQSYAPLDTQSESVATLSMGTAAGGTSGTRGALPPIAQTTAQVPVTAAVGAPAADEGDSRVVKSGSIALVVKDKRVSPTLTAVQQAARAEGGYIASSSSDEYGETPSGEVTIRVPVAKFENLVAKVRGLDAKVRTASTSGRDVTAAYSDLESQLRTLKATRERFLLILSKTKTISEILTVQQRVDTVSGQIDKIEGQRTLLANQSDLSTLTVSVSEEGDPVVKATTKPRSGIAEAFHNAVDGFVTGVEAIISHSGRALLWLLCLGVVAVVMRSGWRVARRRMV